MSNRKNGRMGITLALSGAGVVIALMAGVLVPAILSGAPVSSVEASAGGDSVSSPVMAPSATAPIILDHETVSCDFSALVGMSTEDATAKIDEAGRPVRVLAPDTEATLDYSPVRVNLNVDDKGVVKSITCG